jgi:hypothetical protein
MELAGIYVAAWTRKRVYPILVSKGISDVVGFDRHPDWTKYACETAASGAMALLRLRPFEPREKPDLVPLKALAIAEIGVRQIGGYPAATIAMTIKNNCDRSVRITEIRVKTLQHEMISSERATDIDKVPEYERPLHQIGTTAGDMLKVAEDTTIQSRTSNAVWIGLCNRKVNQEVLLKRFGLSLFRVEVSLIVENKFEFKVGTFVLDLYGGNPHGTVMAIQEPDWSKYNQSVDLQMLRDCMTDRYISAPSTQVRVHEFLRLTGDAA